MVTRSEVSAQNQFQSLHFTEVGPKFSPKLFSNQHLEQNIMLHKCRRAYNFTELVDIFQITPTLSDCKEILGMLGDPVSPAATPGRGCSFFHTFIPQDAPD